ncbi:MAG TPA: tetratricopeptide repeat protein, partial [Chroococcales cyanobacterium]
IVASATLPATSYVPPAATARTQSAAAAAIPRSHSSGKSVDWEHTLEKGNHMLSIGQSKEAADFFSGKVSKYPDSGACHVALGRAYKRMGRIDQAKSEFRAATEVEPTYGDGFYEYGCMLESDKQFKEAAACFQRFVELEPDLAQRKNVPDRVKFCMNQ